MVLRQSEKRSPLKGKINNYQWHYLGKEYSIVSETIGSGTPALLLPAFSTVSSRTEMTSIAHILSDRFQVTVLDWLGFGDSARPKLDYQPILYQQLLNDFIANNFENKIILIAAGHASGYALEFTKNNPNSIEKVVLIAPTWKGPLRAMGANETIAKSARNLVRMPILGQILYYLNTTPSFLHFMYRRHVYVDSNNLTKEFIAEKRRTTQQKGARFAPASFVTGGLDPVNNRNDFLSLLQNIHLPILTIIAENAPPKSKAEMEAINSLLSGNIQTLRLTGTLGIQEEYGEVAGRAILEYLSQK
jgi:pimeloyl-ACP methyl ester carboxylesterase